MENRPVLYRIPHFDIKTGKFSHFSYWGTIDFKQQLVTDHGHFTSPGSNNKTIPGWHEQWTGKTDKNGKRIFEGDKTDQGYVIMWSEKQCLFCEHSYWEFTKTWSEASYPMDAERIKITGTIHD